MPEKSLEKQEYKSSVPDKSLEKYECNHFVLYKIWRSRNIIITVLDKSVEMQEYNKFGS